MDGTILQAIWIGFVFAAYLIIIFTIVGDLMRDHDLSGWWKALWIFLLILFPLLTGLVYFIVRGKGMTQRAAAEAQRAQAAQAEYIKSVAGSTDPADQIANAKKLLDDGTISQKEFEQIKSKALA
jgi:hypothetical protein